MGFLVKLDTNGRDYHTVKRLIQDGLLDYVAIDIKHVLHRYHEAVGAQQPDEFFYNYQKILQLLLEGNIEYEYRTTIIKGMHNLEDIELMAQYIRGAKHYYLQNYVGGNTLDPDFGGEPFAEDELREFQAIAAKYVEECKIRK
jgi:pyruvate formate lyase activating enzyme